MAQGSRRVRSALCHAKWFVRLGMAARRWRCAHTAGRTHRGNRRARYHDRRESISVRARCAMQMARIAGQGREPAARRLHGAWSDHQEPQEVQTAELHSPTAGTLCWPLCRSRRLQHLRSIRGSEPHPRSREHSRRLSARVRSATDGAGDAVARRAHRCCRCRTGARFAVGQTRRRPH